MPRECKEALWKVKERDGFSRLKFPSLHRPPTIWPFLTGAPESLKAPSFLVASGAGACVKGSAWRGGGGAGQTSWTATPRRNPRSDSRSAPASPIAPNPPHPQPPEDSASSPSKGRGVRPARWCKTDRLSAPLRSCAHSAPLRARPRVSPGSPTGRRPTGRGREAPRGREWRPALSQLTSSTIPRRSTDPQPESPTVPAAAAGAPATSTEQRGLVTPAPVPPRKEDEEKRPKVGPASIAGSGRSGGGEAEGPAPASAEVAAGRASGRSPSVAAGRGPGPQRWRAAQLRRHGRGDTASGAAGP